MKKSFILEDLDCANCAAKIESAIRGLDGVISASVSFMTGKLVLEAADGDFEKVADEAAKLVKQIDSDVTLVK